MLYCYITHQKKLFHDYNFVVNQMNKFGYNDYLIFYGGKQTIHESLSKVIKLDCDDTYEGLPNKIHSVMEYYLNSPLSSRFSHICKMDCNIVLKSLLPFIPHYDYYGYTQSQPDPPEYRRTYHFGKCSKDSEWNSKRYDGDFVTYCGGGVGYTLSNKSIELIVNNPPDRDKEIYEDLYIGKTLLKYGITPVHVDTLSYIEKW